MQVHRDINNLPKFKRAAITIGTFDGVHTGHLKIIEQLKKQALLNEGESVIITFDPHPRTIVDSAKHAPPQKVSLLNTLQEKIELIEKQGVDHLVIVPFTEAFSSLSAEDYISKFLVEKFNPNNIIIGYDHHFGKGRSGNYKLLELFADEYNFTVNEIPQYILDDIAISSTRIREAIANADLVSANKYLGYEYNFSGTVISGDQIGRTLGYPTANIKLDHEDKIIPAHGIYIVTVLIDGLEEKGMLSIGIRPTVGGKKETIEVNVLDFDKNIYGHSMKVTLKKYLRQEIKFDSLDKLVDQMQKDEIATCEYFNN